MLRNSAIFWHRAALDASAVPLTFRKSYTAGASAASLLKSSGEYARTVVVRALPPADTLLANFNMASPSGISSVATMSY